MADIGKKIRYYRKINDMSQKELAKRLHVASTTISNWEMGRNDVNSDYYPVLAKIFDIEIADLLKDKADNTKKHGLPTSSKPYLDYQYKFNYLLSIIFVIAIILTVISPLYDSLLVSVLVLIWIIIVESIQFKKYNRISTKYFDTGKTLFYDHKKSAKEVRLFRKEQFTFLGLLFLSVNLTLIASFGYLLMHTDDYFAIALFSLLLIALNGVLIHSLIVDYPFKTKGKVLQYHQINLHFFLARYKLIFVLYSVYFIFYFLALKVLELNPYEVSGMVILFIVMILTYIMAYYLVEMNKKFYSGYQIKVK